MAVGLTGDFRPGQSTPDRSSRTLGLGLALFGLLALLKIIQQLPRLQVLPLFILAYLVLALTWPWPPNRFLIPLLPILLAFLGDGVRKLLNCLPLWKRSLWPALVLGGLLVFTNLLAVQRVYQNYRQSHYPVLVSKVESLNWQSYQEIFAWIKQNTRPGEVIAYGLDSMLYLYTGRQAFRPFLIKPEVLFYGAKSNPGDLREFRNFLEVYRPGYLLKTPLPDFSEAKPFANLLREVHERHPGWLTPVFQGQDGRFRIYRIHYDLAPKTGPPATGSGAHQSLVSKTRENFQGLETGTTGIVMNRLEQDAGGPLHARPRFPWW